MVLKQRTRGRPAVSLAGFFADVSLVEVREVIDFIYNAVEVAEGLLSSSAPLLTTVFQNISKICIVGSPSLILHIKILLGLLDADRGSCMKPNKPELFNISHQRCQFQ